MLLHTIIVLFKYGFRSKLAWHQETSDHQTPNVLVKKIFYEKPYLYL